MYDLSCIIASNNSLSTDLQFTYFNFQGPLIVQPVELEASVRTEQQRSAMLVSIPLREAQLVINVKLEHLQRVMAQVLVRIARLDTIAHRLQKPCVMLDFTLNLKVLNVECALMEVILWRKVQFILLILFTI